MGRYPNGGPGFPCDRQPPPACRMLVGSFTTSRCEINFSSTLHSGERDQEMTVASSQSWEPFSCRILNMSQESELTREASAQQERKEIRTGQSAFPVLPGSPTVARREMAFRSLDRVNHSAAERLSELAAGPHHLLDPLPRVQGAERVYSEPVRSERSGGARDLLGH